MRLIAIETPSSDRYVVNTDQIASIHSDSQGVIVVLTNNQVVRTMFTDVDHAVDYVQRASSVSFEA